MAADTVVRRQRYFHCGRAEEQEKAGRRPRRAWQPVAGTPEQGNISVQQQTVMRLGEVLLKDGLVSKKEIGRALEQVQAFESCQFDSFDLDHIP
jgi:hypothetical protein